VPGTNPLFAGSTWFGFSSAVDPFSLPALGPNEITAFQFTVEVPEALLPLVLPAQFAGGEGQSDGTPIFTGDHPAQYFSAAAQIVTLTPVPEPSAWMLALVAMGYLLSMRCSPHKKPADDAISSGQKSWWKYPLFLGTLRPRCIAAFVH
jgi:hypothetical protein